MGHRCLDPFVVFIVTLYSSSLTDFRRTVLLLAAEFLYQAVFCIWRGQTPE